ncbi:MAG: peptide ABC transporter substrate-binding protein [Deltaproteobacteria bacterium]|nr:peptide ABC transporter substrate-binding protein [Deltaproteobacteria bacterium]
MKIFFAPIFLVSIFTSFIGCDANKAPKNSSSEVDRISAPVANVSIPNVGRTTLVLASTVEPEHQNPLFAESSASRALSMLSMRHLTLYDDKWTLQPDLAVEIPSIENGGVRLFPPTQAGMRPKAQHLEVTWHLRTDATWEDGVPVTADDFLFAYEIQNDSAQEIIERDDINRVLKMEAKGEARKTLVVTWKSPYAFYHKFAVHPCLPKHRLKAQLSRPGGGFVDVKRHESSRRPFANGPYRLKEWIKGSHMTFVKNERYKPLPFIDELVVRFLPDAQGVQAALLTGEIQGVLPEAGLSIAAIDDLVKAHPGRFRAVQAEGLVWAHVDFNLDDKWLKDKRVRRAIVHATNRKAILDNLYGGKLTFADSYLPPRHWGAHPGLKRVEFDLKKASALLEEAGWHRPILEERGIDGGLVEDKAGTLVNDRGEKLVLSFSAGTGSRVVEQIEEVLQSDFAKVGIELSIENKPMSIFFSKFARPRKFPHMWFYAWVMSPSSVGSTTWQSDMIPSARNQFQGQNFPGWRNRKVTRLLKKIVVEVDEKKRVQMLHRVQELYAEDLPAMPMYFRPVVSILDPRLEHFSPTGTQTPCTWNAEKWRITPASSTSSPSQK